MINFGPALLLPREFLKALELSESVVFTALRILLIAVLMLGVPQLLC